MAWAPAMGRLATFTVEDARPNRGRAFRSSASLATGGLRGA